MFCIGQGLCPFPVEGFQKVFHLIKSNILSPYPLCREFLLGFHDCFAIRIHVFYSQTVQYEIRKCGKNLRKYCTNLSICSESVYVSKNEVIFDRNGAKVYVKNLRVSSERKIRETRFYEIFQSLRTAWNGALSKIYTYLYLR